MKRWSTKSTNKTAPKLMLVAGLTMALGLFYVLYHLIVPFKPFDPLHREATIGEPVIDHWDYGGFNEEGYLQFYNADNGHTTELPPNEKMLALDGKFVMVEKAAPDAITYASPLDSIPHEWLLLFLLTGVFVATMVVLTFHRKHRGKASFVSRVSKPFHLASKPGKQVRFKTHRPSKRR